MTIETSIAKRRLLAPLVALMVGIAGCACDGKLETAAFLTCEHRGGFSLSSPTFKLPQAVVVHNGGTCLTQNGVCEKDGSVLFEATSDEVEGNAIVLSIMARRT